MTVNCWTTVEIYPNRMKWLAVQFPIVKLSLYLTETSQMVKRLLCFIYIYIYIYIYRVVITPMPYSYQKVIPLT
jgi:hypothetical protein